MKPAYNLGNTPTVSDVSACAYLKHKPIRNSIAPAAPLSRWRGQQFQVPVSGPHYLDSWIQACGEQEDHLPALRVEHIIHMGRGVTSRLFLVVFLVYSTINLGRT